MRVALRISTNRIIETQSDGDGLEALLANAIAAGIPAEDVQVSVMTEQEYLTLLANQTKTDSENATDKAAVLAEFRTLRDTALARLNGIQIDSTVQSDIDAIKVAKQALKDMPQHASVVAAVGGDATEDALQVLYFSASLQLYQSAPNAYTAFRGLDL